MTPGTVGRRYGRALFELASEAGVVESVGEGLIGLSQGFDAIDPGQLAPGQLSAAERQKLAAVLAPSLGPESLLGRFVAVLAENDRLDQLPAIQRRFEQLQDVAVGRVRVLVRTAAALSSAERDAVRQRLEAVTGFCILDEVRIDPTLLGGISVEAQGRVYDGSIRTQLARLERRMAG
jgi:F-type H+-transporting ATPase subunit delta